MEFPQLVQLTKETAKKYAIEPSLFCAVVEQESDWNVWAVRFEPLFEKRYIHPALPDAPTTEEMTRAMSYGLCQLMGQVARELGFGGKYLSELCDPFVNLQYGCKHFSNKLKSHNFDIRRALLGWNGGGNLQYPDQVLERVHKYAG